jgi:signal transduction histidine kinase
MHRLWPKARRSAPGTPRPDGGRWRALAEVTTDGFASPEDEDLHARITTALTKVFDGPALVVVGPGDGEIVVIRGVADDGHGAGFPARALALGRAVMVGSSVVRDDTGGSSVLGAPVYERGAVVGAVVVGGPQLGAEDAAVLECFAAHAARALGDSERRRATGELAAGISHHLNNLMTVALGNVQLVLRHAMPNTPRALAAVERAILDAADVVRRLMASSGRPLVGTHAGVDLNALVEDTLAMSRARWHDEPRMRGVAIDVRFEPADVLPVVADEAEVRELLLNLVLNAVEAVERGGEIRVRTWTEGGRVVCAVSDTGEGMTPDVRQHATEPFFTTRGPARLGLGLSMAAAIVKRHRGTLGIETSAGEGTTVSFRLPAGDPSPQDFREAAEPAIKGLRILVVDDEAAVRNTIAEMLVALGHEATVAGSGHEALARLDAANGTFDLVLTDLGMPGLTGWDVIERVKARWPGLPVILVTGWGEYPRGGETRHPPDATIAKPLTDRRLREVITGVV